MKKILLLMLLSLIFTVNVSNLNAEDDHLEPVIGVFDLDNDGFEYYQNFRKILLEGMSDTPELRLTIFTSFDGQSVLNIEMDYSNNKYYMKYNVDKENELFSFLGKRLHKYNKEITKGSVDLIKMLFTTAINRVHWHNDNLIALDGAYYYFTVTGSRRRSGMIYSPDEGTKMGRLVDIGYELIELVKGNSRIVEFDSVFSAKIQKLTENIENQK
jgi:hypothetical protein